MTHAFPYAAVHGCNGEYGMTLRDYFAAQAVSAILDQYDFTFFAEDEGKQVGDTFAFSVAKNAYSMADAMMEARK
jgi:hypothetical protein